MKISLIKISGAISLVGILFLLFLSNIIPPPIINIKDITEKELNNQIKIIGEVTSIKNFERYNFQIITLKDNSGEISAIIDYKNLPNLKTKDKIILIGKVDLYNKEYQIQVDKITLLLNPDF